MLIFDLGGGRDDKPLICVQFQGEEKKFHVEEISAMILSEMKSIAQDYIGEGA